MTATHYEVTYPNELCMTSMWLLQGWTKCPMTHLSPGLIAENLIVWQTLCCSIGIYRPFCVHDIKRLWDDPPYRALYDLFLTHRRSYKYPTTHCSPEDWIPKKLGTWQILCLSLGILPILGLWQPNSMRWSSIWGLYDLYVKCHRSVIKVSNDPFYFRLDLRII